MTVRQYVMAFIALIVVRTLPAVISGPFEGYHVALVTVDILTFFEFAL